MDGTSESAASLCERGKSNSWICVIFKKNSMSIAAFLSTLVFQRLLGIVSKERSDYGKSMNKMEK